jgi:predicted GNAT family acetyltransferase
MSIDRSAIRLEKRSGGGRYSYAFADGSEAEMTYVETSPGVVTINHTETPRRHRGGGTAAALVTRAVEDFRAAGLKVIPTCWFARGMFDAKPKWQDLLYRG